MRTEEFKERQIIVGFRTTVLGLVLFIIELLWLPVYGALQRYQVNGNGFYEDFMKYACKQPYPLVFMLTAIIIILGISFIVLGYRTEE